MDAAEASRWKDGIFQLMKRWNLKPDHLISPLTRLKLGEGAMGAVAESLEPLIIPSYHEWLGQSPKYSDVVVHSVMAAPLVIGRRLVGAIATVHSDPARVFNKEDLRLLNMFAPQAAIAIENARLYTAAQRQKQYFEQLLHQSLCGQETRSQNHTSRRAQNHSTDYQETQLAVRLWVASPLSLLWRRLL